MHNPHLFPTEPRKPLNHSTPHIQLVNFKTYVKDIKKGYRNTYSLFIDYIFIELILKEILDSLIWDHLLIEDVSTSLWALNHLDNL